jgi:hypothetical protein
MHNTWVRFTHDFERRSFGFKSHTDLFKKRVFRNQHAVKIVDVRERCDVDVERSSDFSALNPSYIIDLIFLIAVMKIRTCCIENQFIFFGNMLT